MTKSRLVSPPAWVGVVVFILSGFAGLVYEATWSRYLKIILGHEAYAQALVLGIFLGGLAVGAALGGRFIHRISSPIVVYAVIESILALMAVYFHDVFVLVRSSLEVGGLEVVELERWLVAALLILPQAILLGVTFPMLAAALTRWRPQAAGNVVAVLYFANSFGGALGALAVGFFLVNLAGLPGTMYAGALASAAAGLLAWIAHHNFPTPGPTVMAPQRDKAAQLDRPLAGTLALVALGTGLASLVYEVIWVRMLALVLGSSTRAFEIMLATFILGLACGGYFIRKRVDRPTRLVMLAQIQLLMGAFVIASCFYYEQLFNLLELARFFLPLNDLGYLGYGLASIVLGAILMFGPTFCAGMTLPLLTREAMATAGEKALGSIYAWNTLGSIAGIVLTVHILLPFAGLQQALLFGAALDLALGIWLLRLAQPHWLVRGLCCGVLLVIVASVQAPFSATVLTSGPYRTTNNFIPVSFLRHGKTATISIHETILEDGFEASVGIRTNGKSDGTLHFKDDSVTGGDVLTMMLSGALPLLYHHQARRAALIGMGTGYTAATLLRSDILEELVTIEIEPAVLEAARLIPPSAHVYTDPRSHFAVTDAKTFFTSQPAGSFDIIVSEPSNPWVSGLSSLFSKEHFELMHRSLAPDGVLLQWFQLYESNPESMAAILSAIDAVFPDYILYTMQPGDIAVITSPDRERLNQLEAAAWQLLPRLAEQLADLDLHNVTDVGALALADRQRLEPYIASFQVPANSDYFPILDEFAAQGFYKKTYYSLPEVIDLFGYLFTADTLPGRVFRKPFSAVSPSRFSNKQNSVAVVQQLLDENQPFAEAIKPLLNLKVSISEQDLDVAFLFNPVCNMDDEQVVERLAVITLIMSGAEANLLPQELAHLWGRIEQEVPCLDEMSAHPAVAPVLELFRGSAVGDHNQVVTSTEKLLLNTSTVTSYNEVKALSRAMLANMALDNPTEAVYLGLRLGILVPESYSHAIRFVGSHAVALSDN